MRTKTSTAPAPAVAPTPEPATEAGRQALALLRSVRSAIPADFLLAHLVACHASAGPFVLLAAAEAVRRRLQIAAEQKLAVRQRPQPGTFGDYRTSRPQQQERPYRTRLSSLQPLVGSCDCPDFRANSLGLCKHLLVVLADLARRPRLWQRALQPVAAARRAELHWQPVKPLLGDGDWLRQVTLQWPEQGSPRGIWASVRRRFAAAEGELSTSSVGARGAVLAELQRALQRSPGGGDPALAALVAEEQQRLQVARDLAGLRPTRLGFRRRLYPYQQQGVARFLQQGRLLLADDMGLGKTTQAVAICNLLFRKKRVHRGLLVVPAPLKQQWLREWRACCNLPIVELEGQRAQRQQLYAAAREGFLLTNYEQLLRDLDLAQRWEPDLMLLDEAQRIKNWQTRTAATIKQLQPRYRLVLTGTPFENRLLELDSILEWLDRRPLQPLWRLQPLHGDPDGGGMKHLDVLRLRLQPVLLRRRRQEVLDQLPARADTRIDVPLQPAQRDEHDARLQPIAALLKTAERRPLKQAEFLRLMALFTEQRIVSNGIAQFAFDDVWPGVQRARPTPALLDGLSMPKLGELRLLLQQVAIEQERRVVVFSQWRRALRLCAWAVGDLLRAAGLQSVFFTGGQSQRQRNASLLAFHDDWHTRVLFATDAGGVGLNLQHAASCCVHFDLPWNPAVFEQRVGRIWRLGQTEKVEVYSLVGEACIESRMAEVLGSKQAAFHAVFDGDGDEVRFERQGGFLAAARQLVAAEEGGPIERDGTAAEDAETEFEDAADDAAAPDEAPDSPPAAGDDEVEVEAERAAARTVDPAQVRSLLAGLTVKPRSDGGMVLEADRAAAGVLAEVLRGLAGAIEQAVGGAP